MIVFLKLTPRSGTKLVISQTNHHDLVTEKKIFIIFEETGVETQSLVESLEGPPYFLKFHRSPTLQKNSCTIMKQRYISITGDVKRHMK
jgi:hypothetical protein